MAKKVKNTDDNSSVNNQPTVRVNFDHEIPDGLMINPKALKYLQVRFESKKS